MIYENFNDCYKDLLYDLLKFGNEVGNTIELRNKTFTINNIDSVASTIRNVSLSYMCGELLWYVRGSNDKNFIGKFGDLWNKISDDGLTNNSAYGYIIKYKHGFNQIDKIVELLRKDKNSRRAVININVPNPNVIETKDEMCTIALQFLIRNNKLHCTAMMRSNDIWFGLPYDIIFFTICQKYIADCLDLEYGTYTHFATSLHLYLHDKDKIINAIDENIIKNKITINHKALIKSSNELYDFIDKCNNPKEMIIENFKEFGILEVNNE